MAINDTAPLYISELLKPCCPPRNLRSTELALLDIPKTKLKTYGHRSFAAVAPKLWNGLSLEIRELGKLDTLKLLLRLFILRNIMVKINWGF